MSINDTKVINIFGACGAGKSTIAAGLFYLMKLQHLNVELVTEAAKDIVWDGNENKLKDQLFVSAKQNERLERLRGKVEYIITDSPLILSLVYMSDDYYKMFPGFILEVYNSYSNINFLINRKHSFSSIGRVQKTSEEADNIANHLKSVLATFKIPHIQVNSGKNTHKKIYDLVMKNVSVK